MDYAKKVPEINNILTMYHVHKDIKQHSIYDTGLRELQTIGFPYERGLKRRVLSYLGKKDRVSKKVKRGGKQSRKQYRK